MESKYIVPFVEATEYIFRQFQLSPVYEAPQYKDTPFLGHEVYTVVGITGNLRGQMYLGFSQQSAIGVVSSMMGGMQVLELDALGQSALAELGNMICGNAMTRFSAEGLKLDITPPSVVMGRDLRISSSNIEFLSVILNTDGPGKVELTVGITKR